MDIDAQRISLTGERPGMAKKLNAHYALVVADQDNIQIRSGEGVATESDVAFEVLRFFAE